MHMVRGAPNKYTIVTSKIIDHRSPYNNDDKVWNVAKITKTWHRSMKCTNTVGKTALAVLLDRVATNIQFAKKKRKEKHNKTNHNKTRYACTMHWMLRRIKRWKIQNLLPQGTQALFGSKNINLWKLQAKNKIKNFFSSSLLRYSWHTALRNFKLYGIMIYICHEMIIKVRSVNIHYLI